MLVLASHSYDIGKLWFAALWLAAALPPAFCWLRARKYQFTLKGLLVASLIAALLLAWLRPDLLRLLAWSSSGRQGHLSMHGSWEVPLLAFAISAIFTWGFVTRGSGVGVHRPADDPRNGSGRADSPSIFGGKR